MFKRFYNENIIETQRSIIPAEDKLKFFVIMLIINMKKS